MQKVTEFLEKYVQWVALGLGGLYLLWMVYVNFLGPSPVTVQVPGADSPLPPGQVDEYVRDGIASKLKSRMDEAKPIKINVPNFDRVVDLSPKPQPAFVV